MSVSLDADVSDQLDIGQIVVLDLIRFEIPGNTVGYHMGGRPFTYNGLNYLPNRFLTMGGAASAIGVDVTTRTIEFSDIPTDDENDIVAAIESFNYLNAPVLISHLCGLPESDTVLGVLWTSQYEIDQVRFNRGAMGDSGEATQTIIIDLEPPGRSARGASHVKRSLADQQSDNSATDTGLKYVATNAKIPEEWGQRSG